MWYFHNATSGLYRTGSQHATSVWWKAGTWPTQAQIACRWSQERTWLDYVVIRSCGLGPVSRAVKPILHTALLWTILQFSKHVVLLKWGVVRKRNLWHAGRIGQLYQCFVYTPLMRPLSFNPFTSELTLRSLFLSRLQPLHDLTLIL